jgi:hypothetical protein
LRSHAEQEDEFMDEDLPGGQSAQSLGIPPSAYVFSGHEAQSSGIVVS